MILVTTAAFALTLGIQQTENINQFWASGLKDVAFTARVVTGNQRELQKINKDFGTSYRVKTTRVSIKEPFKLRIEGVVDDSRIIFIINGTRKLVRLPASNLSHRESVANSPGKRQTAFDFGILTPGLFDGYLDWKFVREDRATGNAVFDVSFETQFKDKTRFRIWVDKSKRIMTKREWYNREGDLMATFLYENPKQEDGIWIPSKVTVKNAENALAGVTQYEEMKVNSGLADSLFDAG